MDKRKRIRNTVVVLVVTLACALNCVLSCVALADVVEYDDGDLDINIDIDELLVEGVIDIPVEYAEIFEEFINVQAKIYADATNGDMSVVEVVLAELVNCGAFSYFLTPGGVGLKRSIDDTKDLVAYYDEQLENIDFLIEYEDGTTDEEVTASDLTITGETFAKVCERLKNQYAPHVQAEYDFLTWQNEKNPNYISQLTFYSEGVGFPNGWSECYLVPYYKDEKGSEWYGKTQLHLFISDNKYYTSHKNMLSLTVSSDEFSEPRSWVFLPSDFPYMMLYCWSTDSGYFADERLYSSSSDYIGGGTLNSVGGSFGFYDGDDYYYQDLYTSVKQSDVISQFNYKPTGDEVIDIGFIIYNEPIVLNGKIDFDPSRIDPDGTVALTGDNVYEYTITNGDGGSTVMGDYIENNYTYIYNGDTGGSDGSGGTLAPSVPDVKLDFDNYYEGVDDYVSETEKFFQKVYSIIPEPIMNIIILSFGLLVAVGVIKIIFILK